MTQLLWECKRRDDRRIAGFCRSENIPVITLAPEMAAYAASQHVCLHGFPNAEPGFGHWNGAGNPLAGEILARELAGGR